jgi:hypothetical protein
MKTWLAHTIFGILLVASVAANERTADVLSENDNIEPAVIRVARSHGLTLSEELPVTNAVRTMLFQAPACARPVMISLLSVTFEEEPFIRSIGRQGDVVRYVYLDRIWNVPDRFAIFFEWKRHKALALLGLTQYASFNKLLRLASPPGCEVANAIDWRIVWSRDYLATVHDAERRPSAI